MVSDDLEALQKEPPEEPLYHFPRQPAPNLCKHLQTNHGKHAHHCVVELSTFALVDAFTTPPPQNHRLNINSGGGKRGVLRATTGDKSYSNGVG